MGSRPFVSTCSARLRLCLWLRSAPVRLLCLSPQATSLDLSPDLLPPPSGGLPKSPTRANSLTTWARGKPPSPSPLATSPDWSLDPLLLPNGGPPRSLTRASLPTMLARGLPLSTPPVSLLPPAPTTPPESVLLSAQDIPTAKQQGCTL